jgi:hypothetical protein
MRQQPSLERLVLAALTGWGGPEDRRRSAEAGLEHHLVDPTEPGALTKAAGDSKPPEILK